MVYIDDLPNCLRHTTPRMFADDTSLTVKGNALVLNTAWFQRDSTVSEEIITNANLSTHESPLTFTTISPYMSLYSSLMLCCENFYIHQTYFEKPFLPIFFNQLTNGNFGPLWYSRFRLNSNNLRYCRRESQCNLSNFSSQMMMINIQKAKINLTREISKKASVIRT